jgi:ankyrin repeat protein
MSKCIKLLTATVLALAAIDLFAGDSQGQLNKKAERAQVVRRGSELMSAAQMGNLALVTELIRRGADVNVVTGSGMTVLIWASDNGNEEIAAQFVAAGANIDAQDNDGNTALMCAAYNGHEAIIKLLINAGADANLKNNNEKTALDLSSAAIQHIIQEKINRPKVEEDNKRIYTLAIMRSLCHECPLVLIPNELLAHISWYAFPHATMLPNTGIQSGNE